MSLKSLSEKCKILQKNLLSPPLMGGERREGETPQHLPQSKFRSLHASTPLSPLSHKGRGKNRNPRQTPSILLKNGRIIDPSQGLDVIGDLWIRDTRIDQIEANRCDKAPERADEIYDLSGLIVMPGLVDLHTHLRDPGYPQKETFESGSRAAAAGGFSTILCMANTDPVNDCAAVTFSMLEKIQKKAVVKIYLVGAITKGLKGLELSDLDGMKEAGIVGISEDGYSVANERLLTRAMKWAADQNVLVISHCDEPEAKILERDLRIAEKTGAPLHVAHVSCADSIALLRRAKERLSEAFALPSPAFHPRQQVAWGPPLSGGSRLALSAEVTPHHLLLSHEDVLKAPTPVQGLYRVAPPLRSPADIVACREALREGILDMIATDHAPHTKEEKRVPFKDAKPGMIGLEIAFPLCFSLVEESGSGHKTLTLPTLIERMATSPGRRLSQFTKERVGTLKKGAPADIAVFDPAKEWTIDPTRFFSKSRNTPFSGVKVRGEIAMTFVDGKLVYERNKRNFKPTL